MSSFHIRVDLDPNSTIALFRVGFQPLSKLWKSWIDDFADAPFRIVMFSQPPKQENHRQGGTTPLMDLLCKVPGMEKAMLLVSKAIVIA